jgi:hypothetical protein
LAELEAAKKETQFTKAIEQIKSAIPDVLKVQGQNPLTLLHSALSEGIHALDDATCLEIASDIRLVLDELAERMAAALKEDAEIAQAVSRLMARRSAPTS